MNFRVYLLLIGLALPAPALFAQEAFSTRQIEAALEDGLYPLAEQQLRKMLDQPHPPEEQEGLTLLMIRALAGQGRYDDALDLINPALESSGEEVFAYWKGRALFEKGDVAAALQALNPLPEKSPYAPSVLRLRASAARRTGNLKEAEAACEDFRNQFADHEAAAQNLLDLAEVQLERGRERAATKTLRELLVRFPDHTLTDSARLVLARQLIRDGGKTERERAVDLLTDLGANEEAHARLRAAAYVERAALEQSAGNPAAAEQTLQRAGELTDEVTRRVKQKAARANLLLDDNQSRKAFALFDEAAREAPDAAVAAEILVLKGEALLKTDRFDDADLAFQAVLDVTPDPAVQSRALSGKGWSFWEQTRYEEAAVAFERAAEKAPDTDSFVTAQMKAGDACLAARQYNRADENYARIVREQGSHPLAPHALYQCAVTRLQAGEPDAAKKRLEQVEADYPSSDFASQAALLKAEQLKKEKQWQDALGLYRRISETYTQPPVQAAAQHQQGLILYRLGRWDDALDAFRRVSENHPESDEAPQAFYMRGFCRYLQGDTDEGLDLCRQFVEGYPGSIWIPEVVFWLAEHDYNRGNDEQAHAAFLQVVQQAPAHELADDALFWAGNALMRQDSFLEAFTLFGRLVAEYPQSPLLFQARFAQGEALTELGEFSRAVLAYGEVIKEAPESPLAYRARGRRADCQFTLGAQEPGRYQEAREAYLALAQRPATPVALRLQALYKAARCEEKLGKSDEAFARAMEVVYLGLEQTDPLSPDAQLWFTRAAFDAAAVQEGQQKWSEAARIYGRIVQAGVPAKDEAQKRIEKLKQEHPSSF
jgi:TolA-binding protein